VGDAVLPAPPCVLSEQIDGHFDVVMVASKAYDLPETMESFAAAVVPQTAILPLLNGMRHLTCCRNGSDRQTSWSQCMISAVLDPVGTVHLNDIHLIAFGNAIVRHRGGLRTSQPNLRARTSNLAPATTSSRNVGQMGLYRDWRRITCLMRAPIGDIVAAGAAFRNSTVRGMRRIARSRLSAQHRRRRRTGPRYDARLPLTASMFRDIEMGSRTREIISGICLRRGEAGRRLPGC